ERLRVVGAATLPARFPDSLEQPHPLARLAVLLKETRVVTLRGEGPRVLRPEDPLGLACRAFIKTLRHAELSLAQADPCETRIGRHVVGMVDPPDASHAAFIFIGESIGLIKLAPVLEQLRELVDGTKGLLVVGPESCSLPFEAVSQAPLGILGSLE